MIVSDNVVVEYRNTKCKMLGGTEAIELARKLPVSLCAGFQVGPAYHPSVEIPIVKIMVESCTNNGISLSLYPDMNFRSQKLADLWPDYEERSGESGNILPTQVSLLNKGKDEGQFESTVSTFSVTVTSYVREVAENKKEYYHIYY